MKTPATSRTLKAVRIGALALPIAALATAVIAGSIACGVVRSERAETVRGVEASPSAAMTAARSEASVERSRASAPGLRHVYRVRYEQDLALLARRGADTNANGGMKLRLTGELALAFVGRTAEGRHRLFAALTGVVVDFGAGVDATKTQDLTQELAQPFYVLTEPDGRVRGYEIAPALSHTARNLLRSVVGGSQFAAHADATGALQEDDIMGSYTASYARTPDGAVKKTKGKYEKIATMSALVTPGESAATEVAGQAIAHIGADGWLADLTLDETGTAYLGADMPTATTRVHLELALVTTQNDPGLIGRFAREGTTLLEVGPFGTGDESEAQRSADARIAGNRSFTEIVRSVRGVGDDTERGALGTQLSARLRLTPADAQRALAIVKTLPERDGQWLVGSLGGAGTEAAVTTLGAIANERDVPVAVRAQAATQLAFAGPNAASAKQPLILALDDGSREVRDSAALALGNVARELGDDALAVGELADRFKNAATDDDRATLLRALGNSGSADVLALAKQGLTSESVVLREAAVQSLRFLATGEADRLIDTALASDPADDVREAAVDVVGFRLIELHAKTLDRAIESDSSGRVRSEIVAVVQRALAKRGSTLASEVRTFLVAMVNKAPPAETLEPTR